MHSIIYWTGAVVWMAAALAGAWLIVELFVGLANAISWLRWSCQGMTANGRKPRWRGFPSALMSKWVEFIGYRNKGQCTYTSADGDVWHGIGDWSVSPARQRAPGTNALSKD